MCGLLVPDVVPLMPPPARAFVLGEAHDSGAEAFVAMIDWFVRATTEHEEALGELARAHREAKLRGPGVLDRLLWFDTDGFQHYLGEGLRGPRVNPTPAS